MSIQSKFSQQIRAYNQIRKEKADPGQALALISQAKTAISQLNNLNEAAKMRNLLDYMNREAQRENLRQVQKEIVEAEYILLDKTGELVENLKKNPQFGKGGRHSEKLVQNSTNYSPTTLAEAGISKRESVEAQKFHKLPEEKKIAVIETEKAKVGIKKTRKKIIPSPQPPILQTASGKTIELEHSHVWNYCGCGAMKGVSD